MTTPDYSRYEAPQTWLDAEYRLAKFRYMPPRPDSVWHSYSGSSLDVGAPSEVDREIATRRRGKAKKKSQP